ncbi:uncharacterized protein LOC121855584 isoform X3 [Homarus americanus]|uniref:uncharacterized protein LOC121855584 isoform X3 n=1 Tax=Homarus americanus TaxID=6706 RepID=UPI001C485E66|nr:uncharacterized protein LOC121855584 isoform X3 [Homarus americanus]
MSGYPQGTGSMGYWRSPAYVEKAAANIGQAGMKRDAPRGEAERNSQDEDTSANDNSVRYEQVQDEGVYDMGKYADADNSWVKELCKKLAEEYGGNFIIVRPLKDQPGKVAYFCELCYAEMNAKKSLDLHCSGMKHLKKKNIWLQKWGGYNYDGHDDSEQTSEPHSRHPPAPYRDYNRENYDRDHWGWRADPYDRYQNQNDYEPRDQRPHYDQRPEFDQRPEYGQRPEYDQRAEYDQEPHYDHGGWGKAERIHSPRYQRRLRGDADPYPPKPYCRRSSPVNPPPARPQIPPAPSISTKESLSHGATGVLIKRLADCSVKCKADAELAMDVISLLFKCLKDHHEKKGSTSANHLLSEAENKFNIMKELQKKPQSAEVTMQIQKNEPWGEAYSNKINPNPPSVYSVTQNVIPSISSAGYRQGESGKGEEIRELVAMMRMQQATLPKFKGQGRAEFWTFMHALRQYMTNAAVPEKYKYQLLMDACEGEELHQAIMGCDCLEPDQAYNKAIKILETRFGDKYAYADQLVKRLIDARSVGAFDDEGLRKLASQLWGAVSHLENLNLMSELETRKTFRTLVVKLPPKLRERCVDDVRNYQKSTGHRTGLVKWLALYLEKAVTMDDMALLSSEDSQEGSKKRPEGSSSSKRAVGLVTISEAKGNGGETSSGKGSCPLCSRAHGLAGCDEFRSMSVRERLETVKGLRCCFLCLRVSHLVGQCWSRYRCGTDGCKEKHSRMLHQERREALTASMSNTSKGGVKRNFQGLVKKESMAGTSDAGMAQKANDSSYMAGKIGHVYATWTKDGYENPYSCESDI